jgi:uncharacterized protein (UPF0335 family)
MTSTPPPDDPAWDGIRARYEAGDETVQTIAETVGMNRFALSLLALKRGWTLRGKPKKKAARAKQAKAAKPETTHATILRLKDMLQQRVTQLEQELKVIGQEVDAIANERGIKSLGLLVRTIEKVLDLERSDKQKRRQANRDFKYFDEQQRRELAAKIGRIEAQGDGGSSQPQTGGGGGGGTEQPVALLGEAGPAAAA